MNPIDRKRLLASFAILALLVLPAAAQAERSAKQAEKRTSKSSSKTERAPRGREIRGLSWFSSLDDAIAANERAGKDGRPILFLRLLGELEGDT